MVVAEARGPGKKLESKRDPSSRKAILRMTAKYGLGERTRGLGEADRLNPHPLRSNCAKSAAPEKAACALGLSNRFAHAGLAIGGSGEGMLPLEIDSSEES
jgi:hypothetical protein